LALKPKKILFSKKAVSPVLATLLMIAVAVSMSVIIFMWSQGFLATTSEAASSQQSAQNIAAQSSISIEAVYMDTSHTDRLDIIARNVGTVKEKIGAVYIEGKYLGTTVSTTYFGYPSATDTAVWCPYDSAGSTQTSGEIPAKGYSIIKVKYTWEKSTSYTIKVTTTVGTFASTTLISPA
jgi:flagellin-like protein